MPYDYPVDDYPGTWFDATGYDVYYTAVGPAYHTGADLNNNSPRWDSDRGAVVRAVADGVVTFSGALGASWGQVIVIEHDDGAVSRSAHVADRLVQVGDRVTRGQPIASIGNADGKSSYHLHFDISLTDALIQNPGDWPGLDRERVRRDYVSPIGFIEEHMMSELAQQIIGGVQQLDAEKDALAGELAETQAALDVANARIAALEAVIPPPAPAQWRVVNAPNGLNVRDEPFITGQKVGSLANGDIVEEIVRSADGVWVRHALGWSARVWNGVTYLVRL